MSNTSKKFDSLVIMPIIAVCLALISLFCIFRQWYLIANPTERYLITGEKDGEKVERVVDLHREYRQQSATAPIIKETDGYGELYHHIYYTKAMYDDTIYGFDTICEIRKL